MMQGVFQPTINPAGLAAQLYQQMLGFVIQADGQAERIQEEFLELLRGFKSGEISLDSVEVGENGFSIIPPQPTTEEAAMYVAANERMAELSAIANNGTEVREPAKAA